jgi:hypothetical protein
VYHGMLSLQMAGVQAAFGFSHVRVGLPSAACFAISRWCARTHSKRSALANSGVVGGCCCWVATRD